VSHPLSTEPITVDRDGELIRVGTKVDLMSSSGWRISGPHTVTEILRYVYAGADVRLDVDPPYELAFATCVRVTS
jgi:hypothetical protein